MALKTTALTSLGSAIILSLCAPAALARPEDGGDDSRRPAWSKDAQGRQHGGDRDEARPNSAGHWRPQATVPAPRDDTAQRRWRSDQLAEQEAGRSVPVVRSSRYDDDRTGRDSWRQSPRQVSRVNDRDYRRWNRNWQNDRRYDWRDYRNVHRQVYRLPPYRAPYRYYGYNRISIGFVLQSLFFGQDYWLNDPWQYRLPPSYGPYRWVRYYDDALLVNLYSGEVVDVIYDMFW